MFTSIEINHSGKLYSSTKIENLKLSLFHQIMSQVQTSQGDLLTEPNLMKNDNNLFSDHYFYER